MKKFVPLFFTCLLFTLPVCKGQEADFRPGPVEIKVDRNTPAEGYTIKVTPWQVDVADGGSLEWNLNATGGLNVVYEVELKHGPWGNPQDLNPNQKRRGPVNHPNPSSGRIVRGEYNILLTITYQDQTTVIRLDPDHRVWP